MIESLNNSIAEKDAQIEALEIDIHEDTKKVLKAHDGHYSVFFENMSLEELRQVQVDLIGIVSSKKEIAIQEIQA